VTHISSSKDSCDYEEAKRLWWRQLCIDACFRPIIAAKFRILANNQINRSDHKLCITNKLYNEKKGILTITLVDAHSVPKQMVLFSKIKVSQAYYTNILVSQLHSG